MLIAHQLSSTSLEEVESLFLPEGQKLDSAIQEMRRRRSSVYADGEKNTSEKVEKV
jgi:hypothetical protein